MAATSTRLVLEQMGFELMPELIVALELLMNGVLQTSRMKE